MNGLPFCNTAQEKSVPVKIAWKTATFNCLKRAAIFLNQILVTFTKQTSHNS